ncbi:hypothetical protein [Allobaculum sp. Allo2]|uniref:hypothetical protein n=1 Tax=Allobaculum sp. Allo2 TaxID=2853432 RepID=UPI001F6024E6|nr:hypothetical protein [Allobaculum sp. Allo2]UNT94143.1 hypothetical protein KWG61_05780 [Allobaculum sp. Allo2]
MEENTQQVQFLLKILSNQLKKEFNATLKSYGLTKAQFDTLLFLSCRQEEDVQVNQRDLESFSRFPTRRFLRCSTVLKART